MDYNRQLVFHDEQVAGHGWEDKNNRVGKLLGAAGESWVLKSPALAWTLTSDVLHGDGAGSGELPRHPEGFVPELLIHQRA